MKILMAHNRYQQFGGEDIIVEAERALLSDHGHDVRLLLVDNNDLASDVLAKIKIALSTTYSRVGQEKLRKAICSFHPDIVHVHNFFPQLSPSVYDTCIDEGVTVVQNLQNYRLMCPGGLLMRDGKVCEQCITGSPYQAVLYGCYRKSKLGSLVVAHMVATHRRRRTWTEKVNRFIVPTEFVRKKFLEAGLYKSLIRVKPNFISDPQDSTNKNESNNFDFNETFALFVGRLSPEKGVRTLINAWARIDSHHILKFAGTGILENEIPTKPNFVRLGFQDPDKVSSLMYRALFLIVPSEWFEGFPMVIVEAFAHGLPVLASKLGSMGEVIEEGLTGRFFEPCSDEDLAIKASWLLNNPNECRRMGEIARRRYLERYSPEVNYHKLINIYEEAMTK